MHEKWSEKEIKILKRNHKKMSIKELVELFPNRCYDGIKNKIRRLGLKKS